MRTGDNPGLARVGTMLKGKWRIDAVLGSGGMAIVYAATHRNGHRAAIKILAPHAAMDERHRARFLREAYLANKVGHDAVPAVMDDDVAEDGSAYLVMELLEGEILTVRRRERVRLEVDEALDVAEQVLDVLVAAHDK